MANDWRDHLRLLPGVEQGRLDASQSSRFWRSRRSLLTSASAFGHGWRCCSPRSCCFCWLCRSWPLCGSSLPLSTSAGDGSSMRGHKHYWLPSTPAHMTRPSCCSCDLSIRNEGGWSALRYRRTQTKSGIQLFENEFTRFYLDGWVGELASPDTKILKVSDRFDAEGGSVRFDAATWQQEVLTLIRAAHSILFCRESLQGFSGGNADQGGSQARYYDDNHAVR